MYSVGSLLPLDELSDRGVQCTWNDITTEMVTTWKRQPLWHASRRRSLREASQGMVLFEIYRMEPNTKLESEDRRPDRASPEEALEGKKDGKACFGADHVHASSYSGIQVLLGMATDSA